MKYIYIILLFSIPFLSTAQKIPFDSACNFCNAHGVLSCGKWVEFRLLPIKKRVLKRDMRLLKRVQTYLADNSMAFVPGLRSDFVGVRSIQNGDSTLITMSLNANYFDIKIYTVIIGDSVIKGAYIRGAKTAYCNKPGDNDYFDTRLLKRLIKECITLPYIYQACGIIRIHAYPDLVNSPNGYYLARIRESYSTILFEYLDD